MLLSSKDVAVGMEVAVESGGIVTRYDIGTIERVTPSGMIDVRIPERLGDQIVRFNPDGFERTPGHRRAMLHRLDDSIRETILRKKITPVLDRVNWSAFSTLTLERVFDLVNEEMRKKSSK